jgi:hypothetical protein
MVPAPMEHLFQTRPERNVRIRPCTQRQRPSTVSKKKKHGTRKTQPEGRRNLSSVEEALVKREEPRPGNGRRRVAAGDRAP